MISLFTESSRSYCFIKQSLKVLPEFVSFVINWYSSVLKNSLILLSDAAKIIRLPYQVKNISVYMKRSTEEL